MDFVSAQKALVAAGQQIDAGLSPEEIGRIERTFGFRFPPDLREFLSLGLPISRGWVDWRRFDEATIRESMDWPFDGMCFDIKHNVFWLDEWGRKPDDLEAAFEVARQAVNEAPRLIPIAGHRYIPEVPYEAGNPIFSVYQTDIIYYGVDLLDYLQNEFKYYFKRPDYTISGTPRRISFWSMLADR